MSGWHSVSESASFLCYNSALLVNEKKKTTALPLYLHVSGSFQFQEINMLQNALILGLAGNFYFLPFNNSSYTNFLLFSFFLSDCCMAGSLLWWFCTFSTLSDSGAHRLYKLFDICPCLYIRRNELLIIHKLYFMLLQDQ